ncbi:MAG: PrsW family intramembrane metalloprotease [Clostridia bacterium]|nr:PrsW family intramembrane metalloprotease [Clostridia bacterium]
MDISTDKPEKGKNVIAEFFRQTFRRHGGGEYSELLTRGVHRGNREGLNKKYPWAYVRLFALIFVLFAIFLLIIRFTSNELFVPTVTLFGALCFNLSFLLLLFELYPKKDLSFMAVLLAMLIGGAGADVFAQILFSLFVPSNKWLHAVYAGFFEELAKAVAVIFIIIISRKNSPLAGFVLGAAVGCGFSISEDMGYIFIHANEMPFVNLTTVIELSVSRGLSAVCTHTLWTAAVGWSFCRFKRHFANLAVYAITLLSCGMHICWDLPLNNLALGCVYAGCASIALIECILILHIGRKKVFAGCVNVSAEKGSEIDKVSEEDEVQSLSKSDPQYWKYWGHFTLALAAFLMAVIAIVYCSIPFRERYGTQTFKDADSFVSFMQNGMVFNAEENRQYDYENTENDERPTGRVIQTVQGDDGVLYRYVYTVNIDSIGGGSTYYFPEAVYATVTTAQGVNTYVKEDVYNDGRLYASFFRINTDVTGFIFDTDGEDTSVTAFIYNPAFERDLSEWRYLALFCVFAGFAGVAIVCYVSLAIKSWRVKKLCSTENVSSAE